MAKDTKYIRKRKRKYGTAFLVEIPYTDSSGLPQNVSCLSGTIRHIALTNGIQFNAYMLRHLMSSELLHAGDSVIARDLLGHSSFAMTLDYTRSSTSQLYEAIANRTLAENQPKTKNHVHHQKPSSVGMPLRLS